MQRGRTGGSLKTEHQLRAESMQRLQALESRLALQLSPFCSYYPQCCPGREGAPQTWLKTL